MDKKINNFEKKTYITINSNDRLKENIITTEKYKKSIIELEIINYNKIKIVDVENSFMNKTEILFRNLKGSYDNMLNINTIGGIPINYLNYNDYTKKPIFNIEIINSTSYILTINLNIDYNLIKIGYKIKEYNIIIEKLLNFEKGYEDSSYYKIALPRKLKNIKKIKLVSLEMFNSQNLIRNKVNKNDADESNYISNNNYIYWINKGDITKINNYTLLNEEKTLLLLDNNLNNIPSDWIYEKINEKIFYEHMSKNYLHKINNNLNILKYNFINYLYLIKEKILEPTYDSISLNSNIINQLSNGYLIKFINNNITYILYLSDIPTNVINENNIKKFYINSFYNSEILIEFIYKYTNYNKLTKNYNYDLVFNLENDNNISNEPINIYAFLKNNNLNYDNMLNNNIKIDYKNIKYYLIKHIQLLLNEISQFDYNNYNIKEIFIKLQFEFINYLNMLLKIILLPLSESNKNIIKNSYLIEFEKNNITYRLFLIEKPLNYVLENNKIDFFINDLENIDNFINFIELYTNYDINTYNYNININFTINENYTNSNIPVNIYGYLKNISKPNQNEFIYNNENVNYTFIKTSFLKIIKKIIEEIVKCYKNNYNLLDNNINLLDKKYWKLPIKINTDIYNVTQENITKDYIVESHLNNNDILNIKYLTLNNLIVYNIYPVYSTLITQGNYQPDDLIVEIQDKLNSISIKKYDYYSKTFKENINYNSKLSFNTEINKHNFVISYDEKTNLIKINQYKTIYSFSSLDISEITSSGPFITNEGFPYIFIKHKNHNLYTGNIINISGSSSIFNINSKFINNNHYIYTHKIYRCVIRFLLPLENGSIADNIDTNYFFEGNNFINMSSFNSDVNRIFKTNERKTHIGTNSKNLLLDYDLSKYELILGINQINNNNIIGRVINFRKDNNTSNYILDYALLSDNNFEIGMIFKSSSTNTHYMIIPSTWTNSYLPKNKDIIKSNDTIIELNNVIEGYSIKTNITPNKSSLSGIGGININIKIPIEFSLLFNKNNTISNILGFQNIHTEFDYLHSNTININDNIIDYSYLEPTFNENINEKNRYIYIKTLLKHNYNVGDIIYIKNHLLNFNLINKYNIITLNIKQYEPFISWYNNLNLNYQILIKNSLGTDIFNKYKNNGIIIYYNYPYSKIQQQELGNLGMSLNKYNSINYFDYKEKSIPNIYNFNNNTYIYIHQNQKTIIKNINNEDIEYKTGLRDGYYKVLNNIPCFLNSYYNNYFDNTNSIIIECDYTTINDTDIFNKLGYSETTTSNSSDYSENVLEGYLNKGNIISSSLNTNIIGSSSSNFNSYKSTLKKIINTYKLQLFFPILYTNIYYLTLNNNSYYINNNLLNTINIYKNINYKIDISDISLLNHILIISDKSNNEIIFDNQNIFIIGKPGINNSYISIFINSYDNINNLYLIDTNNYINIIKFNIIELQEITYNINYINNSFLFENNNTYIENLFLHIQFGYKYILNFNNLDIYKNFIIINHNNFNNKSNLSYIIYDDINYKITIFINDNNFPKQLYYHYKNNNFISGKIIFSIYYYYNIDKSLLINTNYIDNINYKIIDSNFTNDIDLNIIDDIFISENSDFFTIFLKKNTLNNITKFIYPYYHFNYLYEDVKKNQKIIKLKKSFDLINIIKITTDNLFILNKSNKHIVLDNIIIFLNNISNTNITANSEFYIIYVDDTQTKIKLGNINNKLEVQINQNIDLENNNISIKINSSYNYFSNELINKSIKINYLQNKQQLINPQYNNKLSIINNEISFLNLNNHIFYNIISSNLVNISNLNNLSWKTPYGSIRITLNNPNNINYIRLYFTNKDINNNPHKIFLYYIEDNIIYYINQNNNINNFIIDNNHNKNEYLLYIESYGISNNLYSELNIDSIIIGNFNNITNNIINYNEKIINIKINNIINTFDIPTQYLDNNIYNEYNSLLLNKSKSSIINIILDNYTNIRYYKFSLYLSNHSIIIDNITYDNYYEFGKITTIQLFGSNNINFSDEIEITEAKYINLSRYNNIPFIEKSFNNDFSFKYYRFKLLNNFDFYPYTTNNFNNINDILNYNFNINISGIQIGVLNNIDYNKLYIEDINYIENVINNNSEYITLELKYNLLNNHCIGENFIICDKHISDNCFSTQNLIIYGEWYTRLYYKGYNTIFNYFKNSKTQQNIILNFNQITNDFYLYGNSIYTIIYSEYLDIYINNTKISITESQTNINIYNITKRLYKKDLFYYTEFTINIPYFTNIDNTLILSNSSYSQSKFIRIHDSYMNEGIPIIQEYLTNNIHIENMNGYYIPEICFEFNNSFNYTQTTNMIHPIIDNNYNTQTYNNLDLVYKSDQNIINNTIYHYMKNGTPLYGYYSDNIWNDNYLYNKNEFYTNFYSILLKGKFLGFNGTINNKINNTEHIINKNINGFEVIDIKYDNNNIKKFIKLNLQLENLGINSPYNYLGIIDNINDKTHKNKYILGYGGNIYEKKIYDVSKFNGEQSIYLSITNLNQITTTNQIKYFSKIILTNTPGNDLYNNFINSEIIYNDNELLDELEELEISFINDKGKLYNFDKSEHSFVLEIIEIDTNFTN